MSNFFGGGGAGAISNETLSSHALGMPICAINFVSPVGTNDVYEGEIYNVASYTINNLAGTRYNIIFYLSSISYNPLTVTGDPTATSYIYIGASRNLLNSTDDYHIRFAYYLTHATQPTYVGRISTDTVNNNTSTAGIISTVYYLGK